MQATQSRQNISGSIPVQHSTITDALNDVMINPNHHTKKTFEDRLKTEMPSKEVLHHLLVSAYSRSRLDMAQVIIDSASDNPAALAKIVVDEVNEWPNKKDGLVTFILNSPSFMSKALDATLLEVVSKGVDLKEAENVVIALKKRGANFSIVDNNGQTLLEIANNCQPPNHRVIEYLNVVNSTKAKL